METICVRCYSKFNNSTHPMAHFYSICDECRKCGDETLVDQQRYNFRNFYNKESE